jgi:hypothetical protein
MSTLIATVSHSHCHCSPKCEYIQSDITLTLDGTEIFYHEHTDYTGFKTCNDVRKYLSEHYSPKVETKLLDENIWGLLN